MDFIHLDEAWGAYPEAIELHERHPFLVVVPNNFGMTYVDSEAFRYGWCAMAEKAGHPRDWDAFHKNLRETAKRAYGVTIWRWLNLNESGFYADISFATTLANRSTDYTFSPPSPQFIRFSRKFADYLYASFVDIYPSQDAVTLEHAHSAIRFALNRRTFVSGREELILHVFNTNPNAKVERSIAVRIDVRGFNLPPSPSVTFASPDTPPMRISARLNDGVITFEVPAVKVWGIVIIGKPLFPRVHLRMVRRGGERLRYPLDNHIVPGEPFEVELRAEILDMRDEGFEVELHLPKGWRIQSHQSTANHTWRYIIVPSPNARIGGGFAITPLVRLQDEVMPSFPLQVVAQPKLSFRILPPCIDAPAQSMSDFKLEVWNNSRPCRAHVTLSPPMRWESSRTEFEFSLSANEVQTAEFKMQAPDVGARFWFYKDAHVKVAWHADYADGKGVDGSASVRVRVFPATFEVYHRGVEKGIMHGYPNAYFRDWDVDGAKRALLDGKFVVIWLVNQDPKEFAPLVDWFLEHSGGVVWMGMPFPSKNCPVELVRADVRPQWLTIGRARTHPLIAPVIRFKGAFGPEHGFRGYMVRAKEQSEVIATWLTDLSPAKASIDGTPAIVISRDPKRRIAYVASDLEVDNERNYLFEERWHKHNLWHLTYLIYNLLAWASGASPI
ncbi:MAG TPA: hypothetical protein EYP10_05630 [Armatimonadetes bacterium]|nr:hypothetical protein [Armatimonadota bacterium]